MTHDHSIFTAHNLLFTALTIFLILPKAIMTYQGQSAAPTALDLIYGLIITLLFFWLEAFKNTTSGKLEWYFKRHFPSLVWDLLCRLSQNWVLRRTNLHEAEEGQSRTILELLTTRHVILSSSNDSRTLILKKALLVGIHSEAEETGTILTKTHQNVMELRTILMNVYGYSDKDIVIMLDGGLPHLMPTRDNILREIDVMIHGAKAGDHFFFHYIGHSRQNIGMGFAEEDGMDEAIIAIDGQDVVDYELKAHLVDPLPPGSTLISVIDSVDDAISPLDLQHVGCNNVPLFQIHKSSRRKRMPMKQPSNPDGVRSISTYSITRFTSLNLLEPSDRPTRSKSESALPYMESSNQTMSPLLPIVRCESPTEFWKCKCHWDGTMVEPAEAARVICISTGNESQYYQTGMITMDIIEILKKKCRPSLKDVMLMLQQKAYNRYLQFPVLRNGVFSKDMDSLRGPQMSSSERLTMDDTFFV